MSCPGLELVALDPAAMGIPSDRNPFGLPLEDQVDVVLMTAWWHRWLTGQHSDRVDRVMRELERRSTVIVGIDGPDRFALTFPPSALARFEVVIKVQGVYQDRELYNYVAGPQYDGANWTAKIRPLAQRYASRDLEKLRLSLPCYATEFAAIRRRARAAEGRLGSPNTRRMPSLSRMGKDLAARILDRGLGVGSRYGRTADVSCLAGLSHVQRIEVLRLLEGLSGTRGIVPSQGSTRELISGTEYGGARLPDELQQQILEAARPFFRPTVGRLGFLLDLRRHRIAVAPTGYGELTFRHGSALMSGAALVCQDLSHVEMMLPLRDRENVAFCRPDLSDLRATVDELLSDDGLRARIGANGRRSYREWSREWEELLRVGIEGHIREAVGAAVSPRASGPVSKAG